MLKITTYKKVIIAILLLSTLLFFSSCKNQADKNASENSKKDTIHISAAASLKDALTEIVELYKKEAPTQIVSLDFAGSGQIRQRVISGAPIDGVLLASKNDMDQLLEKDKVTDTNQLLKNTLVVISNKKNNIEVKDTLSAQLTASKKIAIGEPKTVPAGKYAEETIEQLGLTEQLKDSYVIANDVRQVLAYTESGNVTLGFVYKTDAALSDKTTIIQKVPENLHQPILYYTGTITDSKNSAAVKKFNRFLKKKQAQTIFNSYGFSSSDEKGAN